MSYAEREMVDITEDDKEQSEFDEVLNREEELNLETVEKNPAPGVASTVDETELVGVRRIEFNGHGEELFGILVKNFLLNVLTLGIYYPWAKPSNFVTIMERAEFATVILNFTAQGGKCSSDWARL